MTGAFSIAAFIEVLRGYEHLLNEERDLAPIRNPSAGPGQARLEHVLWMCGQAVEFARTGHLGKANRWLGYVQGVLWCEGVESIDDAKRRNMPATDQFDPDNGVEAPPVGTRFGVADAPAGSARAHVKIEHPQHGPFGCMERPTVDDLQQAASDFSEGTYFEIVDEAECPVCKDRP